MRLFFALLLAANIGFFAWQYYEHGGLVKHDSVPENFQPTDAGVASLTLLRERAATPAGEPVVIAGAEPGADPEPVVTEQPVAEQPAVATAPVEHVASEQVIEPDPGTEPVPAPTPVVAKRCFELGPYADHAAIEQAEAEAKQAGGRTSIRESGQSGAGGYWVRLPDYFSFEEARAKYRELQQKGVDDIAIIPLPDKRYFVSLGVYKRKDIVEERRNEIIAKGMTPVIDDRSETTKLYTLALEYEAADLAPLEALQRTLTRQAPQVALQEVPCQ